MSLDTSSITGPMTVQRSLNNILASLNIAQGKGAYSLRESAIIFSSLQKLNEFVKKYENLENETGSVTTTTNVLQPVQSSTVKPDLQIIDNKENVTPLPEINLNQDEETIEI